MEVRDYIMIVSALIVVIGWYVASWRTRKNEIAKERRTYRLDMLHSFIPIIHYVNDFDKSELALKVKTKELSELLALVRTKFLTYGYCDEIDAYESLVEAFCSNDNAEKIKRVNVVAGIVRDRIRKELKLPYHNLRRKSGEHDESVLID